MVHGMQSDVSSFNSNQPVLIMQSLTIIVNSGYNKYAFTEEIIPFYGFYYVYKRGQQLKPDTVTEQTIPHVKPSLVSKFARTGALSWTRAVFFTAAARYK